MNELFKGKLIRLSACRSEDDEHFARWSNDSEYARFQDSRPAMPLTTAEFAERREQRHEHDRIEFRLRTLGEDRLIGFTALLDVEWTHRRAMLAVGIADREYWARGYGSDAVDLMVRYAFDELNLDRVNLNVWSLNPRAIRAYEKAGFESCAVLRGDTLKDGQRSDSILMTLSQSEWRTRH